MMDGGPNMSVCRLQPREFSSCWWLKVESAILKKLSPFVPEALKAFDVYTETKNRKVN